MSTPSGDAAPIKSTFAGDPDMQELVEYFVSEVPARVDAIMKSFEGGQLDEVRSLAHQLKGAGGSYGFPQITDSARKLEDALKTDGAVDEIRQGIDELVDYCNRASL